VGRERWMRRGGRKRESSVGEGGGRGEENGGDGRGWGRVAREEERKGVGQRKREGGREGEG